VAHKRGYGIDDSLEGQLMISLRIDDSLEVYLQHLKRVLSVCYYDTLF